MFATFGLSGLINAQIPTDSLVGYWPFNGNANDATGNGHNGVVNGATLTPDRFGNPNSAYSFNGIDNVIEINPGINLDTFTISFWYKTSTTTVHAGLVAMHRNSSYNSSYLTQLYNGKGNVYITSTTSSVFSVTDNSNSNDNLWHHFICIYDHDSLKLFIDDILVAADTASFDINQTSLPLSFGAFRNSTNTGYVGFYEGVLDDIRIYNRALNQSEITSLYNENICYQNITVTDTLIINGNFSGYNPVTYVNTIKIYPNPTHDHIYITSDNNSIGYQIKIINTLSQIVYQTTINQTQYDVDLNTWTGNGTYFVQLYDTNGNLLEVRKIILE